MNLDQVDGPHRPRAEVFAAMIDCIPKHLEVRAVAINGQTGTVVVEAYHDGMLLRHHFDLEHRKEEG